ncbi:hypothetical protein [Nevskia ramosa]|uniref:hypothetical protein n=1 Tax=Nevskia ramosa TaxID=64002 RepID=UPI003D09AFD5
MNLYVAQFVLVEECQETSERTYYITSSLLAASDPEQAFSHAQSWLPGYEDQMHNEAGQLVRYHASGLYELEEVAVQPTRLLEATHGLYGVEVGHFRVPLASQSVTPKAKAELAVFSGQRAQQGVPRDVPASAALPLRPGRA